MPVRKDSADSFDEFFGDSITADDRSRTPIKPKQHNTTIGALVENQPIAERSRTPITSNERKSPSIESQSNDFYSCL